MRDSLKYLGAKWGAKVLKKGLSNIIFLSMVLLLVLGVGLQGTGLVQTGTGLAAGDISLAGDIGTLALDPKLCEYGDPLDDNGGSQSPAAPSEPRALPPIPPGGSYPDTVVVDKTAAEAAGCRTYDVKLEITGDPNVFDVRPIDLAVLIDVSGSMDAGSPSVWTKGKVLTSIFARSVADNWPDNEVAIITFAHNMNNKGEGVADRSKAGSTDGDTYFKQEFTSQGGKIESGINNISVYRSGNNIEAGFKKVLQIIEKKGRPDTHKIIILFTDGLTNVSNGNLPGPDWPIHHNDHTAAAIAAGQAAWNTARVYSIGLFKEVPDEAITVARETLDWSSNAGFYEAISEEDVKAILDEIYTQIVPIAADVVVTDKIPENFDLVPGSISGPGVYNEGTRIITWDLGEINAQTTLTYKIKANSLNPGGPQMPTNDWAKLDYINVNGNPAQKEFPIPMVNVPAPLAANAGADKGLPLGGSTTLGGDPVATGGTTPYAYRWEYFADGSWSNIPENPDLATPTVSPTVDMVYRVTVTDAKGCTASDTVKVTILKGAITVHKLVVGGGSTTKKFTIYVGGAGHSWSMRLAHGESATIENLEPGDYHIWEVVPMDYKLTDVDPSTTITISEGSPNPVVTLTNKKVNGPWFKDEDEGTNSFTVKAEACD